MHAGARRFRALSVAGLAMLAVCAGATLSGQIPVQSGQMPPASPQSSPQATPEPPKGTGILIGRVVDASSQGGIQGALVTLTAPAAPANQIVLPTGEIVNVFPGGGPAQQPGPNDPPRQLLTDSAGRFMFRNLAAGQYSIRVTATPYLSGAYGQNRAGAASQMIELTRDDEKRDGIVVRMWKGASISGTVVDEVGEPVIGVSVRTIRRTVSGGRTRLQTYVSAATDDRGAYRISGLTPGDYFVGVTSTSTTMPASTVDAFTQLMFSGGSLASSDLYRDLMSSGTSAVQMVLGGSGGSYRVGDFMFQSGSSMGGRVTGNAPAPAVDERVLTYPTVFYPGAAVIAQATPITIASGEERPRIDLQLRLLPSMRVSGTVMGPGGPARNLGVRLSPAGADDFTSDTQVDAATTVTDANGAFTFLGVTPGSYTLRALRIPRPMPVPSRGVSSSTVEVSGPGGVVLGMGMGPSGGTPPPPPPLPTESTLWVTTTVSVGDGDVGGLMVVLQPGIRLAGRIVFEGDADKPTPEQVQQTSISVVPATTGASVSGVAKRVESDGAFATNGFPPGKYLVSAATGIGAVAGKWRFKSATLGGRVVSDEGLDLQSEDVSGLVVTFTDRLAEISGTVTSDRGAPGQTSSVVIVPADTTAWKQGVVNARRLRSTRASTTGAYTFGDLPPGAYYVAAIADDLPDNWQLLATLDAITRIATRVVVADGAKVSQSLTARSIR